MRYLYPTFLLICRRPMPGSKFHLFSSDIVSHLTLLTKNKNGSKATITTAPLWKNSIWLFPFINNTDEYWSDLSYLDLFWCNFSVTSIHLPIRFSVYLPIYSSIYLSLHLAISPSIYLSTYLSIYPFTCLLPLFFYFLLV